MKRKIFLMLTIVWMAVIFYLSSQPAEDSSNVSLHVGEFICFVFVPGYRDMPEEKQELLAEKIDHPVRKTAHATEYAVLGMLICQIFAAESRRKYAYSLILSAAYASTDEFHQLFVPGRAGMVTDVMIDTAGAAVGILLIFLLTRKASARL